MIRHMSTAEKRAVLDKAKRVRDNQSSTLQASYDEAASLVEDIEKLLAYINYLARKTNHKQKIDYPPKFSALFKQWLMVSDKPKCLDRWNKILTKGIKESELIAACEAYLRHQKNKPALSWVTMYVFLSDSQKLYEGWLVDGTSKKVT